MEVAKAIYPEYNHGIGQMYRLKRGLVPTTVRVILCLYGYSRTYFTSATEKLKKVVLCVNCVSNHCFTCNNPFNCQNVVKQQQSNSNLSILKVIAYTLFIKCGNSWLHEKHGKGCVAACSKILLYKRVWPVLLYVLSEGGLWFIANVSYLSLLSGFLCPLIRRFLCVSRLPVDFQRIQHCHWSQPSPFLQKLRI